MNFLEFKNKMFELGCFQINQVYAWQPGFDRNNFVRWYKKGLLIRLRQGFYTFPEYKKKPDFALYVANRIYRPSYISLHTALAFYGMIPEAVLQFTSITSLKTAVFSNPFGDFSYSSVKDELMFGYHLKTTQENRTLMIAWPEKALADLLYLYPFYKDENSMLDLRLDEDFLHNEMDMNVFDECVTKFDSKALISRANLLKKAYNL